MSERVRCLICRTCQGERTVAPKLEPKNLRLTHHETMTWGKAGAARYTSNPMPPRQPIELRHLATLTALQREGSLVSAARHLGVTQSALSHQLRELEGSLGVRLVERKTKPVRFTRAGERLLTLAGKVLPEVERTADELMRSADGSGGRLHIALECHSCFDWLLPTLDAFRSEFPDVDLDLKLDALFSALDALKDGRVDAVVATDPVEDELVRYARLFRYETRLLVCPDHELADRSHVEPADLEGEVFITYPVEVERLDVYRHFLQPAGVHTTRTTAELTLMIVQWVANDRGIAALPSWAIADAVDKGIVRSIGLSESGLWGQLYVAVRADETKRPPLRRFLELSREKSAQTLPGIQLLGDAP